MEQRKLKFRAFEDGKMIYQNQTIMTDNIDQLWYLFKNIRKDAIIMQFTGSVDNKKKEIYEGDIVKLLGDFHPRYRIINYCEYGSLFEIGELGLSFGQMKKDGYVDCEVVGNIFENPDLTTLFK